MNKGPKELARVLPLLLLTGLVAIDFFYGEQITPVTRERLAHNFSIEKRLGKQPKKAYHFQADSPSPGAR